jgi:endonuclease/exonuclease/phosphatase family metal-dependent hydrolase
VLDAINGLRLVTCNLLHGRSLQDGQVDTERMIRELVDLEPTVLAMQEVDRFQQRSHSVDQVAAIANRIDGASWRFVPAIMGEPGEKWRHATDDDPASGHDLSLVDDTSGPAYGTGLITTLPVTSWHVIRVRPFPLRAPVAIPSATGKPTWLMIDDEPRVCIAAVVRHQGREFTIAGTHASFVPGWNVPQLRQISRALRALPAPRLLLGDLNLPAPVPARVMGWKTLTPKLGTFPGPRPKMQLDHVLLDDPGCRLGPVQSARSAELAFSDHRAIVVDL